MLHIVEAGYDNWQFINGNQGDFGEMLCMPSWEEIANLISALDGDQRTMVTFGNESEGFYMCIAGGADNRYIVYLSFDEEEVLYDLLNPEAENAENMVRLVTGGQEGLYPANSCVTYQMAMDAAEYFYHYQEPSPQLTWEKQN